MTLQLDRRTRPKHPRTYHYYWRCFFFQRKSAAAMGQDNHNQSRQSVDVWEKKLSVICFRSQLCCAEFAPKQFTRGYNSFFRWAGDHFSFVWTFRGKKMYFVQTFKCVPYVFSSFLSMDRGSCFVWPVRLPLSYYLDLNLVYKFVSLIG